MKYDLIQMDLDETIYLKNQTFSVKTIQTIKKLYEAKYPLAINSGRPVREILRVLDNFNLTKYFTYLIGANGAQIYLCHNNQLITQGYLSKDTIKKLFNDLNRHDIALCIYEKDYLLTNKITKMVLKRSALVKLEPKLITENDVNKDYPKILGIIDPCDHDYFLSILKGYGDEEIDVFFSGQYLIEFVAKNMSKIVGSQLLEEKFGIKRNKTLSFGDNYNDCSMLKDTVGVMMGYDNHILKDYARYSTDTCENDGFYHFIKKHIFEE